jgi:hypothetical protein
VVAPRRIVRLCTRIEARGSIKKIAELAWAVTKIELGIVNQASPNRIEGYPYREGHHRQLEVESGLVLGLETGEVLLEDPHIFIGAPYRLLAVGATHEISTIAPCSTVLSHAGLVRFCSNERV